MRFVFLAALSPAFFATAAERPGDWTGNYPPCGRSADLLNRNRMDLGVRLSTSNRELSAAFARAMDFWSGILDMGWHLEDGRNCAIQIVDGEPGLFKPAEAARAQFPGSPAFQGWIAFNPRITLSADELFSLAIHEIGHVLGLPHSPNTHSVMYFLALDGPVFLDDGDLAALAAHHKLRGAGTWSDSLRVDFDALVRSAQ